MRDDFPIKATLKLNNYTIIDECSGRLGAFNIIRGDLTNLIAPRYTMIDESSTLKFEIIDRGSDCLGEKIYYLDEDQRFSTEIISNKRYVDIEIY